MRENGNNSVLNKLWGKLGENGAHPLAAHLADVAAVTEAILKSPVSMRRMKRLLGEEIQESLIERLCFLAAWHDCGKISPYFQRRRDPNAGETINHISAAESLLQREDWFRELMRPIQDWFCSSADDKDTAESGIVVYLSLIWSHHGSPLSSEYMRTIRPNSWWKNTELYSPRKALEELMELSRLWFERAFDPQGQKIPMKSEFQHLYAGILMLADWIASDRRLFPFCGENGRPSIDSQDPMRYARENAASVLKRIGWDVSDERPVVPPRFEQQFGFAANEIQKAVDSISLDESGGLYILEAETGSGKTEAALRLYTRLFAQGFVDGLYFANPRRFAATQLFGRIADFSEKTFGSHAIEPTLAVPGYLRVGSQSGVRTDRFQVDWGELNPRGFGWSAENPKRFLASPLASGTVDQALMAALKTPHAHMRAAALQRSLLVIDEIHSSDAYMSAFIADIILWFKKLGGHVLLMSATLGERDCRKYLTIWQKGIISPDRRIKSIPFSQAASRSYPLLSLPDREIGISSCEAHRKKVSLSVCPILENPAAIAAKAKELYLSSADKTDARPCMLVLCNTVRQARAVLNELKNILPSDDLFSVSGHVTAHHGRYSPEDRRLLDREVEKRFEKNACPADRLRCGGILVATQTIEQSLDVDFDVLITDLCPADVLLQRIGRLHRHRRVRPAGFERAQCFVCVPDSEFDWLLKRAARRYGYGADRAYEDCISLALTWKLLRSSPDGAEWNLPDQNRFIVESCQHADVRAEFIKSHGDGWEDTACQKSGADSARRTEASRLRIEWREPFGDSENHFPNDIGRIGVRLGMSDRTVTLENRAESPFGGHEVKSLTLPGWLFDGDALESASASAGSGENTICAEPCGDGWSFVFAGQRFHYGVEGLLSEREMNE